MFCSSYDWCIRRLHLGKSINVRDVIYTKRINASSALVNNQPTKHKYVVGAERVNILTLYVNILTLYVNILKPYVKILTSYSNILTLYINILTLYVNILTSYVMLLFSFDIFLKPLKPCFKGGLRHKNNKRRRLFQCICMNYLDL